MSDVLYGIGSLPVIGIPGNLGLRCSAHVRKHNDVVLRAQIRIAQFLIGEVSIRNLKGVQRSVHPAFVLRASPRVNIANAGHIQLVSLHRRHIWDKAGRETQFVNGRVEPRAIGSRNDNRAAR